MGNPYIEQENYYDSLNESVKKAAENDKAIEFDKLCYEVYEKFGPGKQLIEFLKETYLLRPFGYPQDNLFEVKAVYFEGFRELIRMMQNSCQNHKSRLEAEARQVNLADKKEG